uniref:Crumbs cell polarity complex component 2b n=1 Tax=Echeneis naucrates TaxID=173247 RepID=A0A665VWF2_ECHNA
NIYENINVTSITTVDIELLKFKLSFCTIDGCLSSPCQNGATCLDHLGDYKCLCPKGPIWYMGRNCDELYDACFMAPCTNCTSYNCTQDIDECHSNPCNGTKSYCVNGINRYSCHCPIGLGADDCLSNVTTCSEDTCQNGGTCVDIPDTGHQCQCATGFQGINCEENIDECQSEPCQNGAICKDGVNAYQCFCVPGFQGYHCDLDINECASRPCQNNGTCLDEVDHYSCACAAGFKGINCEVEIDECEMKPCQNGGTCQDYIAAYRCECVVGFQGQDCEVNIDECASLPCLNEGRCIDGVNSYECDCEGTGFIGDHCEDDIPECASDPCKHGATCLEGTNQYKCLCWPGIVCRRNLLSALRVCTHVCILCVYVYVFPGYEGDNCQVDISEFNSVPVGMVAIVTCRALVVLKGECVHCEVDINECDSHPCQNGATCEDAANTYRCICPEPEPGQEPWGGHDCDVRLVGCQQHQCQHEAGCVPTLTEDGEQSYTCLCLSGWTGERCNTSTTFSFNSKGYVHMQLPFSKNRTKRESDDHNHGLYMHLRFKSTLPDMVLYYRGTMEQFVSLELVSGFIQAKVKAGKVLQVIHPGPVNDGQWHQVFVTMDERLVLTVKGPGCEEGCQVKNEGHNHLIFLQPSSFQQLYIGGAPQEFLSHMSSGTGFIGCMEDFHADGKLLLPQDLIREENHGLELGCTKKDWCQEDPCMQQGECMDMWVRALCQCHRPYYGENCQKEYRSWTFGHENTTSYSVYNISESHGHNFTISFFMRSLKHNGLLLQLSREGDPYLTIYLKEGTVAIYSPHTTLLSEAKFVTDGNNNLVTVKVNNGHVVFLKAGIHRALGNVSIEAGDVAYVGGLPVGKNMNAWGGNFKGCLQDIRLDHKHLTIEDYLERVEIYQASREESVLQGCKSDDTCKDEPCFNDGRCQVTWNDFKCDCSINYSGRLCETQLWCIGNPCFDGARCVDLQDGYECLTEALFEDNSLQYFANSSLLSPVTNITMNMRTRDEDGILLRATGRGEIFCMGLLNSSLLVKLDSGVSSELLAFTSDRTIADGMWHQVQLTMADPTQSASRWYLSLDGQRVGGSFGIGGNLNFLNDTKIWLAEKYKGCLAEVRIGGVYLPLLNVPDAPQVGRFSILSGKEPIKGCQGAPVCDSQPCLNQGECLDQFYEFNCSCSLGWQGQLCETEINECSSSPCVYGTCKDLLADYQCDCEPGYTGKDCQEEVDNCLEISCVNGGDCIETVGTHTCLCPSGYVGKRCQWRFPPVACDATAECLNGGICIGGNSGGNCTCKPGYTGARCETEIDECKSSPCLNGATCLDRLNHFQCVCAPGFSGTLCESNHKEQVPWLAVTIPLTTLCVLLAILVVFFLIMTARKKRQSEGTYSPSSQEVAGARLEMGSVLKVPPEERLI